MTSVPQGGTDFMGPQHEWLRTETHPLPQGGTDFMGPPHEWLRTETHPLPARWYLTSWDRDMSGYAPRPTRYRKVVLTSWDRDMSGYAQRPTRYPHGGTDFMGPRHE